MKYSITQAALLNFPEYYRIVKFGQIKSMSNKLHNAVMLQWRCPVSGTRFSWFDVQNGKYLTED